MSSSNQDVAVQPLVIIRRRRTSEDEHHGGVWKIAYADFMTAMMAFFLVMWLINAADKKTIVQVAAYFNPMRLTDRTAATKGLQDQNEADSKVENKEEGKEAEKSAEKQDAEHAKTETPEIGRTNNTHSGTSKEVLQEQTLFDDPMTSLNVLASKVKPKRMPRSSTDADRQPRDPFDPRTRKVEIPADNPKPVAKQQDSNIASPASKLKTPGLPSRETPAAGDQAQDNAAAPDQKPAEVQKAEEASALEAAVKAAVSDVADRLPDIQVKSTPEGLMVSVLDDATFGMFEIGSAKPKPELIVIVDRIAEVLKARDGQIVIRGHTDGRPYKNGIYDNWRLSSARAQMAYHMLVRGGLDEKRFLAVEGRADREPKVPDDPNAPQNRRIDILIKEQAR